ncbi:MAG TPA: hypothetical protein DGG95_07480 [Cytophagales bacterium]|jgi:hypothetical protein|nr:hypothetical protein [Cytophagales bacterium]
MAKNKIKLRRKLIDESALERHRNYGLLLQQHQRAQRRKKTKQIFIYALVVAVVTVLLLIVASFFIVKWEKERELKRNPTIPHTEIKK